jgi:predicted ATPase
MALIQQLNTLESSGLIRLIAIQPELEYLFRHALVQDAAYGSLLKKDRKRLHLAVGEALEQLYPNQRDELAGTLAHHFEKAEVREKAIRYFTRAGDQARLSYANQEAIDFYRAALGQVEQLLRADAKLLESWREAIGQLHEQISDLLELMGQHEAAKSSCHEALAQLAADDRIGQARVHRKLANIWMIQRQYEKSLETYAEAEALLGREPTDDSLAWRQEWLQIQLEQMWIRYMQNQVDEIAALIEKTRSPLEQYGTPAQRYKFFQGLGLSAIRRDRYTISDETKDSMLAGLAAAQDSGNLVIIAQAHFGVGFNGIWRGEMEEAEEHLQHGLRLAEQIGDVVLQSRILAYTAVLWRMRGRIEETEQWVERSLKVAAAGQMVEYIAQAKANLACVAWRKGDLAEAEAQGRAALEIWAKSPIVTPLQGTALWPLLAVAFAQDQIPAAIEHARALLAPAQQRLSDALTETLGAAIQAREQEELEQARAHLEQAMSLAQKTGYL